LSGAAVTTSIANSSGATSSMSGGTCGAASGLTGSGVTDGSGQCTIIITSPTAGVTTANAATTFSIAGLFNNVTVTRDTDPATATTAGPGGSGPANKLWILTHVRNAANADITGTSVPAGTVVHDEFTTGSTVGGTPPAGTVNFTLYDNGTCNGNVLSTEPGVAVVGGLASSSTFTTGSSGTFSYLAHYNGDGSYPAKDAGCEPFSVTVTTGGCPGVAPATSQFPTAAIFGGFTVLSGATIEDPASLIIGNIHSNNTINFSGNSVIQGNAEAVNGFNGKPKLITGTSNPHAPFFAIPTLAQVLATVTSPPDLTLTGNINVTSANAASFFNKVVFVNGSVHIGDTTVKATFIATGGIDMSAGARMTAADGGHGLAVYGVKHVNASGRINGGVVSPDVNIATEACI
jgi:hypothetical protein